PVGGELPEPVVGADGDVGALARGDLGEEVGPDVVVVLLDELDGGAGLGLEGLGGGAHGVLPGVVHPDGERAAVARGLARLLRGSAGGLLGGGGLRFLGGVTAAGGP